MRASGDCARQLGWKIDQVKRFTCCEASSRNFPTRRAPTREEFFSSATSVFGAMTFARAADFFLEVGTGATRITNAQDCGLLAVNSSPRTHGSKNGALTLARSERTE